MSEVSDLCKEELTAGCPHDDCPEQSDYLNKQSAAIAAWEQSQRDDARRFVRAALGLPEEDK